MPDPVTGIKMIVAGPPGSGKTYSLRTLLGTGLEVFGILTEPNSLAVLAPVLDKMHWTYISPVSSGWRSLRQQADKLRTMTMESIRKLHGDRRAYTQYLDLLNTCENFKDQHGDEFGDVTTWGPDRVLFLDSLTGMNKMVRTIIAGDQPSMTLPQFGAAQDATMRFLDQITSDGRCHFVMTAHVVLEKDEIYGGFKYLISTHGNKLSPLIPNFFTDFVLSQRQQDKFVWLTQSPQADLKVTHLPLSAGPQPQDYRRVIERWRAANSNTAKGAN